VSLVLWASLSLVAPDACRAAALPTSMPDRLGTAYCVPMNAANVRRISLGAWILVACVSCSRTDSTVSTDGGTSDETGGQTSHCTAFGPPACEAGNACCFYGLTGTCQERTACSSTVRFDCQGPSGCAAGEVCCASVPISQAVDSTRLYEGGLAAAGVTATSFCTTTCSPPNLSFCRTSADCTGGASCQALPEGNAILLVLGGETFGACGPVDGGTSGPGDSSLEGGSDSADDGWDAPGSE
jgi:hypothetical protein